MRELEYPFDPEYILRKKKSIRRQLLSSGQEFLNKKIAILGGSTTSDIKLVLELFLLEGGIRPEFYESEYDQYYQDAVFGNECFDHFAPDLIFIHTTNHNILHYPMIQDSEEDIDKKLQMEFERYVVMWEKLRDKFGCPVIQNNFEYPSYRILGNREAYDVHGRVCYIARLNRQFAQYACEHDNFYLNDIHYQSAVFGLDRWTDEAYWYMYKYALSLQAVPTLAYNVANIIKAIYGKSKKALALDLDNTLWGGVVGEDGIDNLEIGQETALGEAFLAFQEYIKEQKQRGILLCVDSKNDLENALAGLSHPQCVLKKEDFVTIKANWEQKSDNIKAIAEQLHIGEESIVFVDDNPAERENVRQRCQQTAVPEIGERPEQYIKMLDRGGFFECVTVSKEDFEKTQMYLQNSKREEQKNAFDNYDEYLASLEMRACIEPFIPLYWQRIAQLTNKSNQFNLTTKRYTQAEIEMIARDDRYLTLYGKLWDKFGDNGVVSVVIGQKVKNVLELELWIMSCRVLKRDMEFAMMNALADEAVKAGIDTIFGYYYPTRKNGMVKDFYACQGFEKISEDAQGNTKWRLYLRDYHKKNVAVQHLR